jgi:hypothetical protein
MIFAATTILQAQSLRLKGAVAGINLDDQTILLTSENGFAKVRVDGATRITRNKRTIDFASIEIGDSIDVRYSASNNTASTVSIKKPLVEGFITALNNDLVPVPTVTITPFRGKPVTFMLNETKVMKDEVPAQLTDLEIGDYAKVHYEQKSMRATILYAWAALTSNGSSISGLKGFVESLRWTTEIVPRLELGVRPLAGKTLFFIVNQKTVVLLNGNKASIQDIEIGDLVRIQFDKVTKVLNQISITRELQKATIKGVITNIQIGGDFLPVYTVTIRQGGKDIPLEIGPNAKIEKNSIAVKAAELQIGDYAVAKYDPATMKIFSLSAYSNHKS